MPPSPKKSWSEAMHGNRGKKRFLSVHALSCRSAPSNVQVLPTSMMLSGLHAHTVINAYTLKHKAEYQYSKLLLASVCL